MKFRILPVIAALALSGVALPLPASAQATMSGEKTVEVGGAPMYPSKTIVENAVNSKDHTTLVAAVKAAGLGRTPCPAPVRSRYSRRPTRLSRRSRKARWTACSSPRTRRSSRPS